MKRWQIIALYATAGPVLGGLLVSVGMVLLEPTPMDMLPQIVAVCVLFAFPVGGLAALGAGVAHAVLMGRAKPVTLVFAVSLAGLTFHLATVFLMGNHRRLFDSPGSVLAFAFPPVASAAILAIMLLRRGRPKHACT